MRAILRQADQVNGSAFCDDAELDRCDYEDDEFGEDELDVSEVSAEEYGELDEAEHAQAAWLTP